MSPDTNDYCEGTSELPLTNAALLTVAEAAALLGVSPGTLYSAIKRGDLPAFAFGSRRGTYRIEPADLATYKQQCSTRLRTTLPRAPQRAPGAFRHLDASRLSDQWRQGSKRS